MRHASAGQGDIHEPTGLNVFSSCTVNDWGDIDLQTRRSALAKNIKRIADVFEQFAQHNVSPLAIGGEHIATYGCLRGITRNAEQPVALIHLDAHHRSDGDRFGPRLTSRGFLRLATVKGFIDPERSVHIGLRGAAIVTAREFQARRAYDIAEQVHNTIGDRPCYLSIDASVFDCGVLPTATAPVPFGLTTREVRNLLDGLSGANLVGAELTGFTPHYDNACVSATLAAGFAFEMLGLLVQARISHKRDFSVQNAQQLVD